MRVLITGSREWGTDPAHEGIMRNILAELPEDAVVVHGDARGADSMAELGWGLRWGRTTERHPANWNRQADGTYDKAAGFKRNEKMVNLGADLCIAFVHGESNGTQHCAKYAISRGVDTWFVSTAGEVSKVAGADVEDVWGPPVSAVSVPSTPDF
jgi:hypothetical protein